eukprot:SAG11_NODE_3812_length_2211_cov_4.823864_2_plen_57_part_00
MAGQMDSMLAERQRYSYEKEQKRLLEEAANGLGTTDPTLSNWRGNAPPSRAATSMF